MITFIYWNDKIAGVWLILYSVEHFIKNEATNWSYSNCDCVDEHATECGMK